MTYIKGSPILAADYNDFQSAVNNVYGIGTGDRGYGQTTIAQVPVIVGTPVKSNQWTNLMHMITKCAQHQATTIPALPPDAVLAIGKLIIAHSSIGTEFMTDVNGADQPLGTATINNGPYTIPAYVTAIDNNRFNLAASALNIVHSYDVTRPVSQSWSDTITTEVYALWTSEDAARAYFNSGGQIRLSGSHPTGSTIDNKWNTILAGMRLVNFAVHGTTTTGSPGGQNIGYFELSNNYQTIYNMAQPGAYNPNIIALIEAKRLNYANVRGGNGNGVQFRITLSDTGIYASSIVSGGTNFSFDSVRATTYLTGITLPDYRTVEPF